jgi:hypothetical protein
LGPGKLGKPGFPDFDGYACYRKAFELNNKITDDEKLYLILGKIDDRDRFI